MKNIITCLLSSTLAIAFPLETRQNTGITENEYTRGGCRDTIFFFARGSTKIGNMVSLQQELMAI
jgi:cutinase